MSLIGFNKAGIESFGGAQGAFDYNQALKGISSDVQQVKKVVSTSLTPDTLLQGDYDKKIREQIADQQKNLKSFQSTQPDIMDVIEGTVEEIAAKIFKDRLDLVKIVEGGGSTGNTAVDAVLRGMINAAKKEAVNSNSKYLAPVVIIGGLVLAKKMGCI